MTCSLMFEWLVTRQKGYIDAAHLLTGNWKHNCKQSCDIHVMAKSLLNEHNIMPAWVRTFEPVTSPACHLKKLQKKQTVLCHRNISSQTSSGC